jgi:membrane protease YdiL (CAAX protease family)
MKKILTFIVLTFLITNLFDVPLILLDPGIQIKRLLYTGDMWGPALAALLTKWIFKESIKDLRWQFGLKKYWIIAFIIPVLYTIITYLTIWGFGFGNFYNQDFLSEVSDSLGLETLSPVCILIIYLPLLGSIGVISSSCNALGEEIGWRGFLTPELYKRFGFFKTSLLVGIIWAVWHYPVLIFSDYNNGTPVWYGLTCFTTMIIALTFIFTWLTIRSKSLFPAMILHATHNLYIQHIFTPLTNGNDLTPWFIDEFGAILPIVMILFALYFILKRNKLDGYERNNKLEIASR